MGNSLGQTGGSIDHTHTVTLAAANLPSHTHTFSATTSANGGHTHVYNQPMSTTRAAGDVASNCGPIATNISHPAVDHTHTVSGTTSAVGSGTPAVTTSANPPFLVLNYIIKY